MFLGKLLQIVLDFLCDGSSESERRGVYLRPDMDLEMANQSINQLLNSITKKERNKSV